MTVNLTALVLAAQVVVGIAVFVHARSHGRRSPGLDATVALLIPVFGVVMYAGSLRYEGSALAARSPLPPGTPATVAPAPDPEYTPSPSLVRELTAEVKRLQAELAKTQAELARYRPTD